MRALTHVHVDDELVQPLSVAKSLRTPPLLRGSCHPKAARARYSRTRLPVDAGERDDEVRMMEIGVPVIEKFSSECTVCIP